MKGEEDEEIPFFRRSRLACETAAGSGDEDDDNVVLFVIVVFIHLRFRLGVLQDKVAHWLLLHADGAGERDRGISDVIVGAGVSVGVSVDCAFGCERGWTEGTTLPGFQIWPG